MAISKIQSQGITDSAVTSAKIGVDVIVAEDIAANAITVSELQDNAVTSAKIADGAIVNADINASAAIAASKLASTLNLSSHTVTLPAASVTAHVDTSVLEYNISLLAFKLASANSLAAFKMVDQVVDEFVDATGISAGDSTNETLASGYYSGSASGPAIDGYVETLLHGDGTNNGTTFTDSSSNGFTVQSSGSIVTSTSSPKFGTASISVPNTTNDYIYWGAGSSSLHLDANPFTFSFWIKTTHSSGTGTIFGRNNGSAGQHNFDIACQISSSGIMDMVINTNTEYASAGQCTTAVNDGAWHHVEFVRNGANVYGFIDGALEGTTNVTTTAVINRESSAFYMGYMNGGHYGGAVVNIDEFEFSPGIARHTSSFTVPGAAWGATAALDMTLVSATTTAEATPTTGDLVILIEDATGTATINTDIIAYISRNAGTNWSSAVTLVDEGDWGANKRILVARDVDISSLTGTTSMRYKIATANQSGSKDTRIHAVSLAWA